MVSFFVMPGLTRYPPSLERQRRKMDPGSSPG
jgi:hypothetical protein